MMLIVGFLGLLAGLIWRKRWGNALPARQRGTDK